MSFLPNLRTTLSLVLTVLLIVLLTGVQTVSGPNASASGPTPLMDTTPSYLYQGYPGGLYPNGSNPPEAHQLAALAAADYIQPRNTTGQPSLSGRIGFIHIGPHNSLWFFQRFERIAGTQVRPEVGMAGTFGDLNNWANPNCTCWAKLDSALADKGIAPAQVQALWGYDVLTFPTSGFPSHAEAESSTWKVVLQNAKQRFPNLALAFLSNSIYQGYSTTQKYFEPYGYENGYAVKWLVEDQIQGDPALNYTAGVTPVIVWGPDLWANDGEARSDGLTWLPSDFKSDGLHPNTAGVKKGGQLLYDYLRASNLTIWLWAP